MLTLRSDRPHVQSGTARSFSANNSPGGAHALVAAGPVIPTLFQPQAPREPLRGAAGRGAGDQAEGGQERAHFSGRTKASQNSARSTALWLSREERLVAEQIVGPFAVRAGATIDVRIAPRFAVREDLDLCVRARDRLGAKRGLLCGNSVLEIGTQFGIWVA